MLWGLLLGSGVVLILRRWPALGPIMIFLSSMFLPFSGPGGFNAAVLGVFLVLGLWLLDMLVRQRKIQLVPSRTTLPLIVFIIISILSFGLGQLPWYPFARQAPLNAQLGGFAIFVPSAGAFLLVANGLQDLNWLKAFTWVFLFLGGLCSGTVVAGVSAVVIRERTRDLCDKPDFAMPFR
jgi:hypothetical protein